MPLFIKRLLVILGLQESQGAHLKRTTLVQSSGNALYYST